MRMFAALNVDPLPPDVQAAFEKLNLSLHNRFAARPSPLVGVGK